MLSTWAGSRFPPLPRCTATVWLSGDPHGCMAALRGHSRSVRAGRAWQSLARSAPPRGTGRGGMHVLVRRRRLRDTCVSHMSRLT
jgi:hypothetical protein